jgi:hypothetical protein
MDESALKTLLDNLDMSRSSLDHWLNFWTFLVVVGVVLEVAFVVWEYVKELCGFKRGEILPPGKPSKVLFVLELLGAAFVAIGVAGELYVGAQIGRVETEIRKANDLRAALLSKESGDAKDSAKGAADASSRAQGSANAASLAAGKAKTEADDVESQAKDLGQQLAATKTHLEAVEAKRAELEKSLINLAICNAPRVIPSWSVGNTKTSVDPLKPFTGHQAIIEFIPDAEAKRAALNIKETLERAGWKIARVSPLDGIEDGVEVQAYFRRANEQNSPKDLGRDWDNHIKSMEAVNALLDFLHSYNWQAREGWAAPGNDIPPDGIKVRVGLYPPAVFVSPPGQKEFNSRVEAMKREFDKSIAELERKQMESLPPETRKQLQQAREEWKAKNKIMSNGPCQVLNPLF